MSVALSSTPQADGFVMPGEFEPNDECWIAWPERPDDGRLGARPAQQAFAAVAEAIAVSEPVTIAVSGRQWEHAVGMLSSAIRVVEMSANDAWIRDLGPTFVIDAAGRRRGVDWRSSAWDTVERSDRYRAPLVLEGGSIHVDGEGTLITTEQVLSSHDRTRAQIEQELRDYTGAEKIVWLGDGAGHVDNLACFIRPGVVALTWTDDAGDPQHAISAAARRRLEAETDARGRAFEVVLVPAPGAMPRRPGRPLAASYVSYYTANDRIVMPLLDERFDDQAIEILSIAYPGRTVVGVPAHEILLGGGDIHCMTRQVPSARTP